MKNYYSVEIFHYVTMLILRARVGQIFLASEHIWSTVRDKCGQKLQLSPSRVATINSSRTIQSNSRSAPTRETRDYNLSTGYMRPFSGNSMPSRAMRFPREDAYTHTYEYSHRRVQRVWIAA